MSIILFGTHSFLFSFLIFNSTYFLIFLGHENHIYTFFSSLNERHSTNHGKEVGLPSLSRSVFLLAESSLSSLGKLMLDVMLDVVIRYPSKHLIFNFLNLREFGREWMRMVQFIFKNFNSQLCLYDIIIYRANVGHNYQFIWQHSFPLIPYLMLKKNLENKIWIMKWINGRDFEKKRILFLLEDENLREYFT